MNGSLDASLSCRSVPEKIPCAGTMDMDMGRTPDNPYLGVILKYQTLALIILSNLWKQISLTYVVHKILTNESRGCLWGSPRMRDSVLDTVTRQLGLQRLPIPATRGLGKRRRGLVVVVSFKFQARLSAKMRHMVVLFASAMYHSWTSSKIHCRSQGSR